MTRRTPPLVLKQDLSLELEAELDRGAYVVTGRVENRTDKARVIRWISFRR